MKKVIFICLLSLSVCLSKPAEESAGAVAGQTKPTQPPAKQETPATQPAGAGQKAAEVTKAPPAGTQPPAHVTDATHPIENATAKTNSTTPKMEQPAAKNETKADTNNAVPKTDDAHKENATDTKTTITMAPPPHVTDMVPIPVVPAGDNKAVTDKPVPVKPADTPSKEGDKVPLQARGFDGASFIGGIILTLGLLAIGFIGFKYYRNQTERNYHTL